MKGDFRYSARALRMSPAFAIAAIGTLARGIGADTAIFSVWNAAFLRPLPYAHPERLVTPGFFTQILQKSIALIWCAVPRDWRHASRFHRPCRRGYRTLAP